MDKKIFIIGAGASGVAAATKLVSNGFEHVTILEAGDRIGGRINTIPFGANVVDMGAQWFDSIVPTISKFCSDYKKLLKNVFGCFQ